MDWDFEPGHTAAGFRCRHMMVTWVRGHFKNVAGRLRFDPSDPRGASVDVEIDAASLWTGDAGRDEHLRSADFLDVKSHPKMRFRSREVEVLSPTEWRVPGDLTIRGVTRPVALLVQHCGSWETPYWEDGVDKGPYLREGFCATTTIDRRDFGVSWSAEMKDGGLVVGNEVHVTIDVEALRKKS